MTQLTQSTAYTKMIMMIASSDSKTGLAGATLTITTSKAGAAFATITPTVTDRGNGWYSLALTTAHTDTLGELAFHITATSADPTDEKDQVIAQNLTTANVNANVVQVNGSAVSATTAQLGVNVVNWNNSVVATPNTAGVPVVDDRSNALRINTAQAAAAGTITLDASASATDNYYNDCMVVTLSGTGAGQTRLITGYTGATKVATVTPNWTTTPSGVVVFAIIALSRANIGAVGGTVQTARDLGAQLDATISSRMATFTVPTNFNSLAITAGGAVTVGTNNDKTGYALTQAFPTNFASLSITAGGIAQADLRSILGSALTGTAANVAAAFSSFYNVATPTGTVNSLPSAIPGAANGLQICGTNAATSYSGSGLTCTFTGNLTGSVGSVVGNIGGSVASVTAGVNVTQIEGADPTDTIRDSVYNGVVENSTTLVQFLRGIVATQFGKSNGMDTSTAHFRDQADTKNRVTAQTDSDGNRASITLDLT
jgi:hypothetical protein